MSITNASLRLVGAKTSSAALPSAGAVVVAGHRRRARRQPVLQRELVAFLHYRVSVHAALRERVSVHVAPLNVAPAAALKHPLRETRDQRRVVRLDLAERGVAHQREARDRPEDDASRRRGARGDALGEALRGDPLRVVQNEEPLVRRGVHRAASDLVERLLDQEPVVLAGGWDQRHTRRHA